MAHAPEKPDLYVCTECQLVYAGTVAEHVEGGNHEYEPPTECGVCGSTTFTTVGQWPHEHE